MRERNGGRGCCSNDSHGNGKIFDRPGSSNPGGWIHEVDCRDVTQDFTSQEWEQIGAEKFACRKNELD